MLKLKKDLKLKNGRIYYVGTPIEKIEFRPEDCRRVTYMTIMGKTWRITTAHMFAYVPGFTKPPKLNTIGRWEYDGMAKTVTGKTVEPDGYGPDGSPSWLLVLGVI